jgi:DNA repair photolyase
VAQAALFPDLSLPTTRDVARMVSAGGVDAIGGTRRGDDATYREIRCRSALNRVHGMPFKWTLNPYRGCTHGCHYCFARRYQSQLELDTGDQFASLIFVKVNFVQRLRAELDRPAWSREQVALGTATDPYQPIEGVYRLTRGSIECLARAATPVGIVTKGPMVVRDRDVLLDLSSRAECRVYLSVPTVDEDAWRRLEPGTAHPLQRLRAVRTLVDAGIEAGVLMAPIVPGLTSQPSKLERTVKAIADSGARHVGSMVMHLEDGTREHFMGFLAREFPDLVERYGHLYAGKYAPKAYQERVRAVVGMLKARYGVRRRETLPSAGGVRRGE